MPPRVSAFVVALMASSLTSTMTALRSRDVTSRRSMNLSYLPSSFPSSPTSPLTVFTETVVARTRTTLSPNVDRKNFAASSKKTPCRLASVDDNYDRVIRSRLDASCGTPPWNRHGGAKLSSHATGDPVSVILKSFFQIQNAGTSATPDQSERRRKSSLRNDRRISNNVRSASLASVEPVKVSYPTQRTLRPNLICRTSEGRT